MHFGVSQGRKVGATTCFCRRRRKVYMFSDVESRKNWKKDVAGNVTRASAQWARVSKRSANR